jgi:membrane-associated protease RseP (regulator of RpoE activity)
MRIELFEKIASVFVVLAVVLVATLAGFFSFVIPKSSGISREEANADQAVIDWLADARRVATGRPNQIAVPSAAVAAPGAPAPVARPTEDLVARRGELIPVKEQVPGIPWQRQRPGTNYFPPREVSRVVYERLQGFDEVRAEAEQGGGEYQDGRYKITWIDPDSALARTGLQPGDQIISVNGHPIGQGTSANRALYESLKGQTRFAILVLRQGQEVMLSLYTN